MFPDNDDITTFTTTFLSGSAVSLSVWWSTCTSFILKSQTNITYCADVPRLLFNFSPPIYILVSVANVITFACQCYLGRDIYAARQSHILITNYNQLGSSDNVPICYIRLLQYKAIRHKELTTQKVFISCLAYSPYLST